MTGVATPAWADRFWRLADRSAGPDMCWPWLGYRTPDGYGQFYLRGTAVYAHHAVCELAGIEVPPGMVRDHLCRNRSCVNPKHIDVVTFRENVLRGVSACAVHARKTICIRGHVFDEANTIRRGRGRECRVCREEREARRPKRDRREYRRAYYHNHKTTKGQL